MTVSQALFRDAVLDADQPIPKGLSDGAKAPAGSRFAVYRNNVVLSLSEALATAFPLVVKLLGTETFGKLAGLYVRAYPPKSPLMMFYGAEFPDFLSHFEPLKHIGYLPDCARLDLAKRQSYHAADAAPFDPSSLLGEDAAQRHIRLAPATYIVRSVWPLHDIWRFNSETDAPKPRATAQDVLITRPEFDPQVHLLPVGAADWLESLQSGQPFGDALDQTVAKHASFDLTQALSLAISSAALAEYQVKDPA